MPAAGADPQRLQRFLDAQLTVYEVALRELAGGAKRSHWMWFVLPQLQGLGRSATARFYGIASREEALAYWRHPVLGPRLLQCAQALAALPPGRSAEAVLGAVDALKLCSCLTLFEQVAPEQPLFGQLIDRFHAGRRDPATLALLGAAPG